MQDHSWFSCHFRCITVGKEGGKSVFSASGRAWPTFTTLPRRCGVDSAMCPVGHPGPLTRLTSRVIVACRMSRWQRDRGRRGLPRGTGSGADGALDEAHRSRRRSFRIRERRMCRGSPGRQPTVAPPLPSGAEPLVPDSAAVLRPDSPVFDNQPAGVRWPGADACVACATTSG